MLHTYILKRAHTHTYSHTHLYVCERVKVKDCIGDKQMKTDKRVACDRCATKFKSHNACLQHFLSLQRRNRHKHLQTQARIQTNKQMELSNQCATTKYYFSFTTYFCKIFPHFFYIWGLKIKANITANFSTKQQQQQCIPCSCFDVASRTTCETSAIFFYEY